MKEFIGNLKATFKFVSKVYVAISCYIIFDSYINDDFDNILLPLYFPTIIPNLIFCVWVYTRLRSNPKTKWLNSIIFSSVSTLAILLWLVIANLIDSMELDAGFILRISTIYFVTLVVIYHQLSQGKTG